MIDGNEDTESHVDGKMKLEANKVLPSSSDRLLGFCEKVFYKLCKDESCQNQIKPSDNLGIELVDSENLTPSSDIVNEVDITHNF